MAPSARKWQLLALAGVVALIVVVSLTMPGPGKRPENIFAPPKKPAEPADPTKGAQGPNLPFDMEGGMAVFGPPEAKIKVVAFIPGVGGCGNETASVLHRIYEANQDRLRVVIADFESEKGAQYQAEVGAKCAGLLINGQQRVDLVTDKGKKVTLEFNSNLGDAYSENDLLLVLDQEFQKAYGEKAKRPSKAASTPATGPPAPGNAGATASRSPGDQPAAAAPAP